MFLNFHGSRGSLPCTQKAGSLKPPVTCFNVLIYFMMKSWSFHTQAPCQTTTHCKLSSMITKKFTATLHVWNLSSPSATRKHSVMVTLCLLAEDLFVNHSKNHWKDWVIQSYDIKFKICNKLTNCKYRTHRTVTTNTVKSKRTQIKMASALRKAQTRTRKPP
jgi:hypothetical protein